MLTGERHVLLLENQKNLIIYLFNLKQNSFAYTTLNFPPLTAGDTGTTRETEYLLLGLMTLTARTPAHTSDLLRPPSANESGCFNLSLWDD